MDFALNLMKNLGWEEGSGLGKDNSGIKEPIKAKLKFGTTGLGCKLAKPLVNPWWDQSYNKCADNIIVQDQDGKVKLGYKEEPKKKNASTIILDDKKACSGFIKSSTLHGNQEVKDKSESDSSDSEEETYVSQVCQKLTDGDLLQLCGGRTAHKGARHGFTMSAKLQRIEEQEKLYKIKSAANDNLKPENTHKKKFDINFIPENNFELSNENISEDINYSKKKHKSKHQIKESSPELNESKSDSVEIYKPKKKKKKSKDQEKENEEIHKDIINTTPSIEFPKKTKKKSKSKEFDESENYTKENTRSTEFIKKKKRKHSEEYELCTKDETEDLERCVEKSKKKKKKNKDS